MKKIYLLVGSTRANRIGRHVTAWTQRQLPASADLEAELVDLAEWNLPADDEPNVPATGQYVHEHTRAWSRKVAEAAGFVFVTPQYNGGYPAPLKNALDHLYAEWKGKPAAIVSYGYHGGNGAAEQLRQILAEGLHMRLTATQPQLTLTKAILDEHGQLKDIDSAFAPYAESVVRACTELAALLSPVDPPK